MGLLDDIKRDREAGRLDPAQWREGSYLSLMEAALLAADENVRRLRADCAILLAQIDFLELATGEGLDAEDAALALQIRESLEAAQ